MFKRLFWLALGMGFGFGLSFRLTRFVRETKDRYSPTRVSNDVTTAVRRLGTDVKDAVAEGRNAMREREAELRAEMQPGNPAKALNAPR